MMGMFNDYGVNLAELPQAPVPTTAPAAPMPSWSMPTDPMARIKEGPWWRKAAYLAAMTLSPEFQQNMGAQQRQYQGDLADAQGQQGIRDYRQWKTQQDRLYQEGQDQQKEAQKWSDMDRTYEWEKAHPKEKTSNDLYLDALRAGKEQDTKMGQAEYDFFAKHRYLPAKGPGKYSGIPGVGGTGGRKYGKLRNLNSWEAEANMPDLNLAMSAPMNDLADVGSKRQALQNLAWKFQGTVYQPPIDDALDQLDQAEQSIRGQQERAMGPGGWAEQITAGLLQDANTPQTRLQSIPGAIGDLTDYGKENIAPYAFPVPYWGAKAIGKGIDWFNSPGSLNPFAGTGGNVLGQSASANPLRR